MTYRHLPVGAVAALLLSFSASGAFAGNVSEIEGRSSQLAAGSTLRVNSAPDSAATAGRGHSAIAAPSAHAPIAVGRTPLDVGRG